MPVAISVQPHAAAVTAEATRRFVELAQAAVAARGRFTVALAGGSTPAGLYAGLAGQSGGAVPWSRTLLFFGDERCVPPDHAWSNFRMVRETLLDHIALPPANLFRMPGEREPAAAAVAYADVMQATFGSGIPVFDLILLGIGDDGHTASLFPGMPALTEGHTLVVATDVPAYVRPRVSRLTLTFPVLNAARHVLLLATGAGKAAAVAAAFREPDITQRVPAGRVAPADGLLTWLVDREAAAAIV